MMKYTIYSMLLILGLGAFACKSTGNLQQDDLPLTHEAGWSWQGRPAYVLKFAKDNSLSLKLDVNNCFGSYEFTGAKLSIAPEFGCTEACCDKPEALTLTNALLLVNEMKIQGNTLTLTSPSEVLVFTAE